MSTFFPLQQKTKTINSIKSDSDAWPETWRKTIYKEYPRFSTIALPHGDYSADLFQTIKKRTSKFLYNSKPLTLDDVGILLGYAYGNTESYIGKYGERYHRAVASPGALYSVEIYLVIVTGSEDLPVGIYHYRIREHVLEIMSHTFDKDEFIKKCMIEMPGVLMAPAFLFCTGDFNRISHKYGMRGYRYVLLEAGEVLQNINLVAEAIHIKARTFGGTNDENVESLLEIDGVTESLIQTIALGK